MSKDALLDQLMAYYHGFYISDPAGNNSFSFSGRAQKEIYVAPLKAGGLNDVVPGNKVVFSEIVDGKEKKCSGLDHFIYWRYRKKDIFIFDNHNHAFVFWAFGLMKGAIFPGGTLVHVDKHKDTRHARGYLPNRFWEEGNIDTACSYANTILNVGNFIEPAIKAGMFHDLTMIDHDQAFGDSLKIDGVLDIDLDIFSPEMDYICYEKKLRFIRSAFSQCSFMTIATSPFFIDQVRAITVLKDLFNLSDLA